MENYKQLEICGNCLFTECEKCNNPGSRLYDLQVSQNGSCKEWESKMKFES